MLNITLKELKEQESMNVERIGYEIGNRMRETIGSSFSKVICLSYLAYLVLENQIEDTKSLIEFTEKELPEEQVMFIKENINDAWSLVFEISKTYTKETLAAVILWFPMSMNRYGVGTETPESIVKLACKILNPVEERVADFCSGIGAFLTESISIDQTSSYWGMEIDTYSKEISAIRLSLLSDCVEIKQGSIFSLNKEIEFDKIFCHYPWRVKVKDSWIQKEKMKEFEEIIPEIKKVTVADWLYITNVIQHLNKDGKAVVVTTNGIMWNGGVSKSIRERLLKLGLIEAVIALPENLYTTTPIATSLLVISKKNHGKKVRMIDASGLATVGRRQSVLQDEAIDEILEMLSNDSENSKLVTLKDIEAKDYVINPARFLETDVEVENGVQFEQIIKNITRGAQVRAKELDELVSDIPTNYQYLMLANIQDGIISEELPYLKELDEKLEKYCIKNNSLVISKNGVPVKVAVAVVEDGLKILANGNMYVIELDEAKVNPYFVKAYLESENGTVALSRVTVGTAMPNIPVDSLKKVMIPLPSLEEQNKIAEKYIIKMDEVKVLRYRLAKATAELKNIYKED